MTSFDRKVAAEVARVGPAIARQLLTRAGLRAPDSFRLFDTVVVVTGGARGIGAATAAEFARHGARVVIGDLDLELAEGTAAAIGPKASAMRLDVTDRHGFTHFLDDVENDIGPLGVLVNNAGVMAVSLLEDESAESVQRHLDVNLHAVIHGSQEAIRRMQPRGTGHLVNVASVGGKMGFVGVPSYCATKFAVVGLSQSLRRQLHGTGIGVTCVMPGFVETDLTSGIHDSWAVPSATPDQVAVALVTGVLRGHAEVYVPKRVREMIRLQDAVPRGLLELVLRSAGGDHLMLDAAGASERAEYDARIGLQ
jgi:NAD(P)-dependent dehydrogenase (short-subunit alcohol dehydrogenase family)